MAPHTQMDSTLSLRSQCVYVNGSSFSTLPVTSGVQQVSVFWPLLFIFYINDISYLSNATMSQFADKLMAYRSIYSASDYHFWQLDIDKLCVWTDGNLLIFNIQKV